MTNVREYYKFAIIAFGDITVTIVAPAIVAALLGKMVDLRLNSNYTMYVIFLSLAFVATGVILVKKIRQYAKEYQQLIAR